MRKAALGVIVIVFVVASGIWLLGREATLVQAAHYLVERLGGRLELAEVNGSLLGQIRVARLRFHDEFGRVDVDDVQLRWRPLRLLTGHLSFSDAVAKSIAVEFSPSTSSESPAPPEPPESLASPISVAVENLSVEKLSISRANAHHELQGLRIALSGSRRAWEVQLKCLAAPWGAMQAHVRLEASKPFALQGSGAFSANDVSDGTAALQVGGTLTDAEVSLQARSRGASGAAKLMLAPFDAQPLTRLELSTQEVDPRAWLPDAPAAILSAEAVVEAGADRKLNGTLSLRNAQSGPLDDSKLPFAEAFAVLQGDLANLALPEVKLDLAQAGRLAGAGVWRDGRLEITADTTNLNLRGLQRQLNETRLAGQVALRGGAARQEMRLDLGEKRYRFRFAGTLDGGVLEVSDAFARAGASQVGARGAIALDEQRAFSLAAQFTNFDPARFGKYPKARLNGHIQAKGEVFPVMQVAADLRMHDSELFGLPAAASGRLRSKQLDHPDVAVDVSTRIGGTRAVVKGTLRDPAQLRALDLQLSLEGASLADLYPIVGVPLPPSPAYRIRGHLVHRDQLWELRRFSGFVGGSDLAGDFALDRSRKPQFMRADLTSERVALADLAGFIGAENAGPGETTTARAGRVLPDEPYSLEKLKAADADVRFKGKQILTKRLPLQDVTTRLIIEGGVLTLAPLNFGVADGNIVSNITLDGSGTVIASRADVQVQALKLDKLVPASKLTKAGVGAVDGRMKLAARGNSIAAMLGTSRGNGVLVTEQGEISDLLLRLSNLDLANTLPVLLRGDRNVPIRCLVADFSVEDGLLRPREFVLDTANTTLRADGTVNFKDETLDLRLSATSKGGSLVSLRGPVLIKGSFAQPSAAPDLTRLAARGGAATVLGLFASPFAAIIPFIEPGGAKDVDCGPLVEAAHRSIE